MSSTDNRIVKMVFDNAQFKKGAAETKQDLADVNKAVDAAGNKQGLLNLSANMGRVVASASKMSTVVTTAIATITNKIVNSGLQMAKSLTIDPLKQGFTEYEALLTKQNVIMNATGQSAKAVKKVLNDLNHYSDKTIFSFADMTEGMTSFVNAGVPLKQAAQAMKGISNASALAGASTQEAQSSFRAFGQALGQGFLGLQDFRQAAVTGKIGTVQFKQTLIDAAVAAGTLTKKGKEYVTANGKTLTATKNFDLSLQNQWASAKVLNNALGMYADTTTKLGKKAFSAAQDVRTFSAFMDTLKESIGSGFSQIFTTLIGGLEESTSLWTGLSNTVGASVKHFFNFANQALKTWKSLGGLKDTIQGFKNILAPVVALFKAVGAAWAEAFPSSGKGVGGMLASISHGFLKMTEPLAWLAKQMPRIVPVLAFFFKLLKMGAGSVAYVSHAIGDLVRKIMGMADIKVSSGGITKFLDGFLNLAKKMGKAGVDAAQNFISGLIDGFRNGSFDTAATIVSGGLLAAITVMVRKLLKGGINFNVADGLFGNIKDSFQALTGSLKAMQTQIQAKTLLEIAAAIGLITLSVVALAAINPKKLSKALGAMAAGFSELLGAMYVLVKISGSAGFVKVPLIAASMVLLAGAIVILSTAVAIMSRLSWEEIGKGLVGVGGAILAIGLALRAFKGPILIRTSLGLMAVGAALVLISGAMKVFATMSWEEMAKGLVGLAGALTILVVAMNAMEGGIVGAAAMLILAPALAALAGVMKLLGGLSWSEIARGLVALGGAMLILGLALAGIGDSGGLLGAAALLIIAPALLALGATMKVLGSLSWSAVAKGLVALGGALILLALGLTAMIIALPGALALTAASQGLLALAATLVILGQLSWGDLLKSLVALAAALTILSIAGVALLVAGPGLMMLGAAIALIGVGVLAAGVGIGAFAAGLSTLVVVGGGAISLLIKYFEAFLKVLPKLGTSLAETFINFVTTIANNTAPMVAAIVKMIGAMLDGANKLLPKFGRLLSNAIKQGLQVIRNNINDFVNTGIAIILGFLRGVNAHIGDIVSLVASIVVNFINAVSSHDKQIAEAGANAIIHFIHTMADTIRTKGPELGKAMGDLGVAMVQGLIGGIGSMFGSAMSKIGDLAGGLIGKAKGILKIFSPSRVFHSIGQFLVQGLTNGIQKNAASAITAVASMVGGQIAVANEYISKFIQELDQKSIAAQARASGLALAAQKAQAAAKKTKSKDDDKAANKIAKEAKQAQKKADAAEKKAQQAKNAQDKKEAYQKASTLEKAKLKAQDAQNQLGASKQAELNAAKERQAALALDKQSHAKGVSDAERKKLQKAADDLRDKAKKDAQRANDLLAASKTNAAAALALQKKAGEEASKSFQDQFDAQAKADKEAADFEKLTAAQKAEKRRNDAAALQAKADQDLKDAKKLAFTDIDAANALAQQAMDEANQARQYLTDAASFDSQALQGTGDSTGATGGQVINLDPTEAAAIAFNHYANLYDQATAAAAGKADVTFNQYNTSPEALSPTEIYRNTNNQITFAVDKLADAA